MLTHRVICLGLALAAHPLLCRATYIFVRQNGQHLVVGADSKRMHLQASGELQSCETVCKIVRLTPTSFGVVSGLTTGLGGEFNTAGLLRQSADRANKPRDILPTFESLVAKPLARTIEAGMLSNPAVFHGLFESGFVMQVVVF